MCVRTNNRIRKKKWGERKEQRFDECVPMMMMSNACRRQRIGHSTMCTTTMRERTNADRASPRQFYVFFYFSLLFFSFALAFFQLCVVSSLTLQPTAIPTLVTKLQKRHYKKRKKKKKLE